MLVSAIADTNYITLLVNVFNIPTFERAADSAMTVAKKKKISSESRLTGNQRHESCTYKVVAKDMRRRHLAGAQVALNTCYSVKDSSIGDSLRIRRCSTKK